MKRLCLLLVFVNIVYFFWGMRSQQVEISGVDKALVSVTGLERLSLRVVNEPPIASPPAVLIAQEVTARVLPVEEVSIESCFMINGFATQNEAVRLLATMQAQQLEASLSRLLVAEEFWLVHPVASSWQQSLQDVKRLKEKGVSDLWLVPSGVDKGVISLGLFAEKLRAERRLKQLKGKKIDAGIRVKQRFSYAVSLRVELDTVPARLLLSGLNLEKKHSINKISC